jgi:hypothetical protein
MPQKCSLMRVMGGACSKHGRCKKCIQNFSREIRIKLTTWETYGIWEDNITMVHGGMNWTHLAQDRVPSLVGSCENGTDSIKSGEFLDQLGDC